MSQSSQVFCQTPDFFAMHLADGGVRIGMYNKIAVSFPASHKLYARVAAVTVDDVEETFDHLVETGYIDPKYLK